MKHKTPTEILVAKLNRHAERISKERDALRELAAEVDVILASVERGLESLEEAIEAFSETL